MAEVSEVFNSSSSKKEFRLINSISENTKQRQRSEMDIAILVERNERKLIKEKTDLQIARLKEKNEMELAAARREAEIIAERKDFEIALLKERIERDMLAERIRILEKENCVNEDKHSYERLLSILR